MTPEHEGEVWVTSTPDLITVTPNQAGAGSLVTIELTTHPPGSAPPSPLSASPPTTPIAPEATTADMEALPTEALAGPPI